MRGLISRLHTPGGDYTLTPIEVDRLIQHLCDEYVRAKGVEPRSGEPFDPFGQ